jgi:hypothetical protein
MKTSRVLNLITIALLVFDIIILLGSVLLKELLKWI